MDVKEMEPKIWTRDAADYRFVLSATILNTEHKKKKKIISLKLSNLSGW